jgi:hypothetical protein
MSLAGKAAPSGQDSRSRRAQAPTRRLLARVPPALPPLPFGLADGRMLSGWSLIDGGNEELRDAVCFNFASRSYRAISASPAASSGLAVTGYHPYAVSNHGNTRSRPVRIQPAIRPRRAAIPDATSDISGVLMLKFTLASNRVQEWLIWNCRITPSTGWNSARA